MQTFGFFSYSSCMRSFRYLFPFVVIASSLLERRFGAF